VKAANTAIWLVVALIPAFLLFDYFLRLIKLEVYQFAPILIFTVAILFWLEWDKQLRLPARWFELCVVSGGVLFGIFGSWIGSPWLGYLATLAVWGGFLFSQRESDPSGRGLWPLLLPACVLLRLPFQIDNQLTAALQRMTSLLSSYILDTVGIIHRLAGNVFFLEGGSLFVENACSGVQSLFSLLFVATMILVWFKRPVLLLPLYLIVGTVWALVMNVVRVTSIAIAQEWYGMDLAHGWQHQVLGYACLMLAIGLLFSTDRLFQVLFFAMPENEDSKATVNPLISLWNRFLPSEFVRVPSPEKARDGDSLSLPLLERAIWPVTALILMMAVTSNVMAFRSLGQARVKGDTPIWNPPENLLANLTSDLTVHSQSSASRSQEPALGKYSLLWNCDVAGLPVRIAVSQYDEYHDLCQCYGASGWKIMDRELLGAKSENDGWRFVRASFANSENTVGTLIFSSLTRDGLPIDAREEGLWTLLAGRFGDAGDRTSARFDSESMNIQFWLTTERPLQTGQLDKLKEVHELVRRKIQQDVKASSN
jgi:exosortase